MFANESTPDPARVAALVGALLGAAEAAPEPVTPTAIAEAAFGRGAALPPAVLGRALLLREAAAAAGPAELHAMRGDLLNLAALAAAPLAEGAAGFSLASGRVRFDEAEAEAKLAELRELVHGAEDEDGAREARAAVAAEIRHAAEFLGHAVKGDNAWASRIPSVVLGACILYSFAVAASGISLALGRFTALFVGAAGKGFLDWLREKRDMASAHEGWAELLGDSGREVKLSPEAAKIKAYAQKLIALQRLVPAK